MWKEATQRSREREEKKKPCLPRSLSFLSLFPFLLHPTHHLAVSLIVFFFYTFEIKCIIALRSLVVGLVFSFLFVGGVDITPVFFFCLFLLFFFRLKLEHFKETL